MQSTVYILRLRYPLQAARQSGGLGKRIRGPSPSGSDNVSKCPALYRLIPNLVQERPARKISKRLPSVEPEDGSEDDNVHEDGVRVSCAMCASSGPY